MTAPVDQAVEAAAAKIFQQLRGHATATYGWQDNIPGDEERARKAHEQRCIDLIANELVELASQQEVAEGDYKNMWLAAVSTLAKIDALLGLPEDGCNDPDYTLSALQDYMAGVAEVTRTDVPYTLDDVRAWIKQGQDRAASQQEVVAPVGDAAETLKLVCEAFHIGERARDQETILSNVRNARRRSDCLWAIEHKFFMVTEPDEDDPDGEPFETCLLNWGDDPDNYIKRFGDALAGKFNSPGFEGIDPHAAERASYDRSMREFFNRDGSPIELAASRVPVASPAEPVPKLAGSPFESYVAQVIHAAFADGWGSCRDAEFAGDEAMNDAFNQSATLGVCLSIDQSPTPPVGAGGSVGTSRNYTDAQLAAGVAALEFCRSRGIQLSDETVAGIVYDHMTAATPKPPFTIYMDEDPIDVEQFYRAKGFEKLPPTPTMTGAEIRACGWKKNNYPMFIDFGNTGEPFQPIGDAQAVPLKDGQRFVCIPSAYATPELEMNTTPAQSVPLGGGEVAAWLIECEIDGMPTKWAYTHNAVGDYRQIDPKATSTPLYRAQPLQPQDAKDARPETMEIRYETFGNCLWHTDCKVNSFKSGIMQVLAHGAESSTMKCLHCGKVGAYPKGRVGTVCVPVISTDTNILASKGGDQGEGK